ncbi:hypothetical protein [Nocardia brasiliensis]|uniref:hypothetical protein n=1 Tax=Nocardia brasiliensis TaxID=37326 RepID=UPI0024576A47|nr:hypothetical protein [Nocardia brasiliensis]
MERSRTKIAGPAIAVGAVSLGLVLIGACGVGKQDTYVAPPPLQSDPNVVAAAAQHEGPSVTAPKISIPPSPTWQIAPYQAPHATPFTGFATTTTGEPTPEDPSHPAREGASSTSSAEEPSESPTTRPTRPATTTSPRPTTTTEEPEPTTTRPRPSGNPSSEHSHDESTGLPDGE